MKYHICRFCSQKELRKGDDCPIVAFCLRYQMRVREVQECDIPMEEKNTKRERTRKEVCLDCIHYRKGGYCDKKRKDIGALWEACPKYNEK